jgi:CRP-like cAMP-binding protein
MDELLAKYGMLTPLLSEEKELFRRLPAKRREYKGGTELLLGERDDPDPLFVIERGRLFASCDLASGHRAITRLYYPGDIVGTANIPFERAVQDITVQTDAVLYHFPRSSLIEAFSKVPRVAAIFYTFAALENAILNDRLVAVGRMRGKARLASLILESASRQKLLAGSIDGIVTLDLTQVEIGDAIGLTEVQVNRLFRELDAEGVIDRRRNTIRITDYERLSNIGHFKDRYADLDIAWFNAQAAAAPVGAA